MTFTLKLDWSSYIISIAKSASKKIGALIHSLKFLSSEVASYVNKSIIWPCSEYSCHFWAGAPSCLLELLDQIQRQICRTVGSSLAPSLESLSKWQNHCQNVASLSLLWVLLWLMFIWTGWTSSASLFSKEVYLLFW